MTKIALLKLLSQIASTITTIVLIAAMPTENYGLYVTISSIFLITLNTYNSGASLVEASRVSRLTKSDFATPNQVIPKVALISLPVSFVELALLLFLFPDFIMDWAAIAAIVLYVVSENLKYTLSGHFRGSGGAGLGALVITAPNIIFAFLAPAFFLFLSEIYQLFLLRSLASLIALGYAFSKNWETKAPLERLNFSDLFIDLRDSIKVGLSAAANQVYKNTGLLLVSFLLGYSSVASYKIALLVAFPMTIPAFVMSAILVRPINSAIRTGNQSDYEARCRNVQFLNIFVLVVNVVIGLVYNDFIAYITLDSKYLIDTWLTLAVVFSLFVQNAFGPTNLLLHLQGRSVLVLTVTVIGAGLNFIVAYLLIVQVGMIGAVVGTALSMTFIQTFGRVVNNRIGEVKNGSIERVFF